MINQFASQARSTPFIYWNTVFEYDGLVAVSTLTTLLSFTDFGSYHRAVAVFLENQDVSNNVHLIVEPSHGGVRPLDSGRQEKVIAASKEDFVFLAEPNPFSFVRISAQTDSPGFPLVNVRWAVLGLPR